MANKYESYIGINQKAEWGDWDVTSNDSRYPLFVESESLSFGWDNVDRDSIMSDSRIGRIESIGTGPKKPGGSIKFTPRYDDILSVLACHFQNQYTRNLNYQYTPVTSSPTFGSLGSRTAGTYGTAVGDVWSFEIIKKYYSDDISGDDGSILFSKGICDSLTLEISNSSDLTLNAGFKFCQSEVINLYDEYLVDDYAGTYSIEPPFAFFDGTFLFEGASVGIEALTINSKNNVDTKMCLSRNEPVSFPHKSYMLEGNITLDMPRDGLDYIGSMVGLNPFSITGTLYQDSYKKIIIDLPNCIRTPFNINIPQSNSIKMTIPFKAMATGTVSPITITVSNGLALGDADIYDAGTIARTLSGFTNWDAGTGVRDLGLFEILDRNLE